MVTIFPLLFDFHGLGLGCLLGSPFSVTSEKEIRFGQRSLLISAKSCPGRLTRSHRDLLDMQRSKYAPHLLELVACACEAHGSARRSALKWKGLQLCASPSDTHSLTHPPVRRNTDTCTARLHMELAEEGGEGRLTGTMWNNAAASDKE